jgi:hypothetical protein
MKGAPCSFLVNALSLDFFPPSFFPLKIPPHSLSSSSLVHFTHISPALCLLSHFSSTLMRLLLYFFLALLGPPDEKSV